MQSYLLTVLCASILPLLTPRVLGRLLLRALIPLLLHSLTLLASGIQL
jgi:hypothetical protein